MKNRRALLFALALGLIALILNAVFVSNKETYFEKKYGEVGIIVASKDILRYQIIDETMLQIKKIPKEYVQPKAIHQEEIERLIGSVVDATILSGEQITDTKLARPGESRISAFIQKEDRACTIAVNEITGVAGLIRPGDNIDIIGTFKTVDAKTRIATQAEAVTLLQNKPVLAVGRNYAFESAPSMGGDKASLSAANASFSNVTIAASPRECMDLSVSQQVGVLTLTLRSYLNRFGGSTSKQLREEHSTTSSATGITAPLEISNRPKWVELRGEQSMMVP